MRPTVHPLMAALLCLDACWKRHWPCLTDNQLSIQLPDYVPLQVEWPLVAKAPQLLRCESLPKAVGSLCQQKCTIATLLGPRMSHVIYKSAVQAMGGQTGKAEECLTCVSHAAAVGARGNTGADMSLTELLSLAACLQAAAELTFRATSPDSAEWLADMKSQVRGPR